MTNYLVAGSRPWNEKTFDTSLQLLSGYWFYLSTPDELVPEFVEVSNAAVEKDWVHAEARFIKKNID